jgi:hypothetical protein
MTNHPILQQLFNQVPMMLVDMGAIVAASLLWRRAPLSSLLIVLACSITLALLLVYPFAYQAVVHALADSRQDVARISALFGVAWAMVGAISTTLLVCAVYAGRRKP